MFPSGNRESWTLADAAGQVILPHQGSRTSSLPQFVEQVNPDIAIITAGYRNHFCHPKDDVLDRYRALGSRIYRTDYDGALLLTIARDGEINVQRYRALYRRYWHAPLENPDLLDDECSHAGCDVSGASALLQ